MQSIHPSCRWVCIAISSLLFLAMCRSYESEPIDYENGLVCQAYTDYFKDGSSIEKGNECKFTCPDGLILIVNESRISDPRADLRSTFCHLAPTASASPVSPTRSPTPTSSTPQPATATSRVTPTPIQPLLSEITTCNGYASFVNFRLVEPAPDLEGRSLVVRIDERIVECGVEPAFPSILTCDLPPFISYPAGILVTLDDVQVNEFQLEEPACSFDVATRAFPPETPEAEAEATELPPTESSTEAPPATPPG